MAKREDRHAIRIGDVHAETQLPVDYRTEELYLPMRKGIERMTPEELRRGLCYKSGGKLETCRKCPAPCTIGRRLLELEVVDE